ncbi:MAG: chemotaxis protein CheV [Hahellaceae bacterium]|nr:chemotaxis protein CheV [Hahellaceae bacterium]MCP5211850.1 chemotaxis protein CheV [Hahellaceae bacterium]
MAGVLDTVDQRTQLVGENRLELLMFRLIGRQVFAINVFKVQEVLKLPNLTLMPHRHPVVCGVTHLRGNTVPVIDLSMAIKMPANKVDKDSTIIVTEYNRNVQAFLVGSVDRIVNMNWEEIQPPPKGAGRSHYLTAITRYKDQIVEIIDVEKVLSEIVPFTTDVSPDIVNEGLIGRVKDKKIMIVDDSPVAIAQAKSTLHKLGLEVVTASNGLQAFNYLKKWADECDNIHDELLMLITDAEMPEMDGYRLTTEIRNNAKLKDIHIVLHTSLSGSFNRAMVEKVGCDGFLSKFQPDELAKEVQNYIEKVTG